MLNGIRHCELCNSKADRKHKYFFYPPMLPGHQYILQHGKESLPINFLASVDTEKLEGLIEC